MSNSLATVHADLRCASRERRGETASADGRSAHPGRCKALLSDMHIIIKTRTSVNCTPFVRQYDILSNKWGVLLCQKEYQTNDIRQSSREWL